MACKKVDSVSLKNFISKTSIVFKTFDFSVKMTKNNSEIWNFTTSNPNGDKRYVVYCAPDLGKSKGVIKIALKKVPSSHRLVVVCSNFDAPDLQESVENNYCLVTLDKLNEYGITMLDILEKEGSLSESKQKFTSALT
ncbi:MAG: hypothetical protein EP319_04895 [Deltaproteobacteria bacterium]|nr:MAG: hypothetical protein EP319_04895 [Deltaproteobacteria bacterium]